MKKPQLFLLNSGFGESADRFCPDCALVVGYLSYQPKMHEYIDIKLINFEKPRSDLVNLLGENLQNSPALVFAEGDRPQGTLISDDTGRAYINNGRAICRWLGIQHGGLICDLESS